MAVLRAFTQTWRKNLSGLSGQRLAGFAEALQVSSTNASPLLVIVAWLGLTAAAVDVAMGHAVNLVRLAPQRRRRRAQ